MYQSAGRRRGRRRETMISLASRLRRGNYMVQEINFIDVIGCHLSQLTIVHCSNGFFFFLGITAWGGL
jgi:hypothetical protein